jgi:hypothetical protein
MPSPLRTLLLPLLFLLSQVTAVAAGGRPRLVWSKTVSATEFGFWDEPAVAIDSSVYVGSAD